MCELKHECADYDSEKCYAFTGYKEGCFKESEEENTNPVWNEDLIGSNG